MFTKVYCVIEYMPYMYGIINDNGELIMLWSDIDVWQQCAAMNAGLAYGNMI